VNTPRSACFGKVKHVSAGDARKSIERWKSVPGRKGKSTQRVYHCSECGWFHLSGSIDKPRRPKRYVEEEGEEE